MKARARIWLLLLALAGVSTWLALAPPRREPESAELAVVFAESPRPRAVSPVAAGAPALAKPQLTAARKAESAEVDSHPHPLTPEREHLQQELRLVAALNDAMDLGEATRMRELIERYRAHDPRDQQGLQAGYSVIAACLSSRDAETRARAQAYYDRERASVLRRYVRRHCLE
ncbi:MAG TPA: hypothetical protein VJR89_24000 [Polyangiales bacterium]|nr:hypothetical protein [Polyangiales bacterium]